MKIIRPAHLLAGVAMFVLLCTGCAGSAIIKSSQDLSTSGVAYADAMDGLIEVTIDTVIDSNSNDLLKMQANFSLPDAKEQETQLRSFLTTADQNIENLVGTLSGFRSHTRLLKAYFENLQSLANADIADGATTAVEGLSQSINKMNKSLMGDEKLKINDQEQGLLGQLSGMVAQRIQATTLEKALKRDAPIIGEQLMVQEKLLEKLRQILTARYQNQMEAFKTKEVINPYIKKEIQGASTWKANRKKAIEASFFDQRLDSAVQASKQLQATWQDILQGKQDLGTIQATLTEITDFTNLIKQLQEADED